MPVRFHTRMAAAVTLAATLAGGCVSDRTDPAEPDPRDDEVVEVRLTNFAFSPANIRILPGTRVRWINTTNTFHTVTPDGHTQFERWTTSVANDTLEHVFQTPGDFGYFCEPHRSIGMTGRIVVQ